MFNTIMLAAGDVSQSLSTSITSGMFSGMFDEILKCVPIILPAVISFLGFRKAWSFVKGEVKHA